MIAFRQTTFIERIKRLWPAYRRRRDAEMREAIRLLVSDPALPCTVGSVLIPHGYGLTVRPLSEYDDAFPWR